MQFRLTEQLISRINAHRSLTMSLGPLSKANKGGSFSDYSICSFRCINEKF